MTLCEQCGSIQIVRAQPEPADRLVAFFTAKRPFICRRCGWRGRRGWSDEELKGLLAYGAGGAEHDPTLGALDGDQDATGSRQRKSRGSSSRAQAKPEEFDLAALALANAAANQPDAAEDSKFIASRASSGRRRSGRKRSRRREIVAAVAATALVMLLVVILGLTGSCSGGSEGF